MGNKAEDATLPGPKGLVRKPSSTARLVGWEEGLWTLQEGSSLQPPVKIRESRAPTGPIRSLPLGPHHQRKAILKGTYNSWSMAKLP